MTSSSGARFLGVQGLEDNIVLHGNDHPLAVVLELFADNGIVKLIDSVSESGLGTTLFNCCEAPDNQEWTSGR
eukprot:CAMPEP_0167829688 /NCGR_PEP_ID=MMETSP0112_2-20121227/12370_1 /TAXON_ID=91324 /ORGANISM="Lotharella globosa, Strain CCCM811" /LENGTH=72 /DNA_ID=CAMNT_0007733553 /DNA_START=113 /DNA_END=331 /DNA_ORIENTATION=-